MKILRASNYIEMPWKNGGGATREVYVKWRDQSQTTWDWRISIASVVKSGPFSEFHGIDRSLSILDGRGFRLRWPHGQTSSLDQSSQPFAFAGDASVFCDVTHGPTVDLNVMTQRSTHRHHVQKLHCSETVSIALGQGWNALVANTPVALLHNGRHLGLQRWDAALELEGTVELTPVVKGDVYVVGVTVV